MKSPWLEIPLADYEAHMGLPEIGQAQLLSDIFAEGLHDHRPRSVAILGCAGGNGLDRVDVTVTERVVCVDINARYVEQAHARFRDRIARFESIVGDVQTDDFSFPPVELIFAGLLLEYVDVKSVSALLCEKGVFLTVVQLPSNSIPDVTPSPFVNLNKLGLAMRFVPPGSLRRIAATNRYHEIETRRVRSAGGKEFQVQAFQR